MEKEGPSRALVVFGSESGTAEKAIKELAAQWKAAGNWTVVDIIDGNAAAKQGLETPAASHDASFGTSGRAAVDRVYISRVFAIVAGFSQSLPPTTSLATPDESTKWTAIPSEAACA